MTMHITAPRRSVLIAVMGLLTAAPALAETPAPQTVTIDNFLFGPKTLTVDAGTEVVWINRDNEPHTVVAVDKSFKSSALDEGEKFAKTLTQPGTYAYYCSLHPHMTGTIIVR